MRQRFGTIREGGGEVKPANENPDFGKVCNHGHLKRSCYICELEEQCSEFEKKVFAITKDRDELKKIFAEVFYEYRLLGGCKAELLDRAYKIMGEKWN
jgi:hypothetical protein